jgi:hypothetical protein
MYKNAVFVTLTAMAMNNSLSWEITVYNPLKVNQRFGGTYRLHFHGLRINETEAT